MVKIVLCFIFASLAGLKAATGCDAMSSVPQTLSFFSVFFVRPELPPLPPGAFSNLPSETSSCSTPQILPTGEFGKKTPGYKGDLETGMILSPSPPFPSYLLVSLQNGTERILWL